VVVRLSDTERKNIGTIGANGELQIDLDRALADLPVNPMVLYGGGMCFTSQPINSDPCD
jgi:hypothetical protein